VKKLQDSLAEKDTIISDLRNEVNEKQETIDNQALEYQDADNARYEYELQVQNLQLSYNSACMELSRLKKLAEEHQETMRSKLLDVDAQRQEEFEGLKAHYDSILERKELALSSIKEEVANLREENQSLIELESHSTSMLKETTAELEKLKEASSLADKEHQAIVHALRTVQHELEEQQIRANADSAEYRAKSERAQEMLTQVIASLQQDIKDTIANLQQDIKETVSSLHKDISDKKASIESLLCQISDLEAKLVCVTQDAKRSKEGLTEEANKTKEAHEIIESLRRLTAEKDAEITSISANFDALYADYCGMREESQRTNESLKNQLCSAQSKYADEIEEIRVSQAKEREELSRNLDEAQETITNCRNQLNSMQQLLEQRKESIETLQNKEFEMDSLLKEKQGEISKLHNVVESLQTSLNEQSIKNQNYKEEIDTIKQALHKSEKNLELQTRNLEEEASERDNEMRILYNDLTKTCVELKLNIEATSSSSSKLERSRDIIRCLKEAVKDQQSNAAAGLELANSRERAVSRLERTLSSKERDIQSLHKEVEKYKSLNTDLKNQQFLIKSHSTELEIKINSMESELAKVTHARKISDELNNGLQKKNIELDNRVHTLSCELESLRKDMLNAEITINEYEVKFAIIGVATEQLSEQVRLNQHLQSDFDDVSRELENMVHQNEIHETEIESLRNELNQSKALEASIRSRLVEVEKSLHQKTLETNNLMNENESLLNDNSSLTSTITNQMQLIEELKSDLKSVENKIVEERSKYESSYESQKRIATILEKHLSAKSEEVCRIRKAKDEEVSKLKSALEAKSSEIQSCTKKIEELEKSFAQVCKENETIQSLRRETEETANDAITMLEEKDSRIEELLKKLETVESSNEKVRQQLVEEQSIVKELRNLREHLTTKNDQNEKNQETLKRVVQTKSAEISALQGQIVQLKAKLSTSHDSIQEYRQTLEEERQKHSELLRELEDSYSDVKARLFGAEKLNLIHDKECARLLDDIESKFNEISQLTSKVETLESINAETLSRNNELQASLATQKEIIEFLENEIALQRAESTSKDDRISSPALQHLKEEISMLKSKLEDKDTELEILDDESKDALAKLSELESKLDASEEEVHLLCEAIEEKEREINELHETIAQLREEKSEALSLLSNLKDGAKNCRQEENVASSDASRQSLSPSAAEIMSKHNELLDNLEKMKYAIHDAISPSKSDVTESFNSTSSSIEMLQKELEEKNSLLETLSEKVQTLMRGVEETEKALHTKETFVNELNITCQQLQTEKAELKIKMKNLMAYIKQLEDVLSHEVKHRREVENSLFSAQKENKILTLENHTKSEELASANKQLKQKEQKVAEQMTVARNLARQLQTTKQKIIALKQHLQQEGLLKDGNLPPAPLNSHAVRNVNHGNSQNQIPDINATMSYDSINWSISEDDNST
jgi:epidermal growth factor receptor substrate 15